MTCFPIEKKAAEKHPKIASMSRMLVVIASIFFIAAISVGMASATDVGINWSMITNLVDGVGTIMPSITNLITQIIQPIILLVVVGFLVGLFDGLLGGIESALSFGRRRG